MDYYKPSYYESSQCTKSKGTKRLIKLILNDIQPFLAKNVFA